MATNQNDTTKQSECDSLRQDLESNNRSLEILKKQRNDIIYTQELDKLKTIAITIQQLEDENANIVAARRKLGCDDNKTPKSNNDNQTAISTSSVRRKDARALEKIIKTNN
ncbi:MAG: hypothetical protein ABWZ25_01460 [Chitinophagaceae bacterium]